MGQCLQMLPAGGLGASWYRFSEVGAGALVLKMLLFPITLVLSEQQQIQEKCRSAPYATLTPGNPERSLVSFSPGGIEAQS